ncbi:MAG: TonB-dependent receptor [Bacteroidota bacterium]
MDLKLEFTHMNYLAQQPGGLTDTQFGQDPTLSTRFRNWFQVGWNSGAVNFNYRINSKIKINNRTFFLKANRYSLGDLGTAIVLNQNRTLIKDDFTNWGNEFRLSYNYDFIGNKSVLLIGNRYYQGFTDSSQGDGTSESNADFDYVGGNPSLSDYDFPSRNVSVFAENIFNISDKFSITPGLRYEFIRTEADGSFTNQVRNFAGEVIFEETTFEQREDQRDFLLYGLGLSYKLDEEKEVYLNYSRNYRGINFTDIRVDIPFLVVDPDISDESGFNLDLGIRGSKKDSYLYDLSLFYLSYEDRIGNTLVRTDTTLRTFTYRTNIGDAAIVGFESYAEVHVPSSPFIVFTNFAWIVSEYTKILEFGTSLGDLVKGNNVELVPAINLKTGLKYQGDKLKGSLLFSYVSSQFSDAANTKETNTGIEGRIPAYKILDLSLTYPWKNITFGTGINNLLDEQYFSRRAAGYPGPGLIPSQPRSIYLSVEARF